MTKIIPKLGLSHIADSSLGEYAQDKTDKINAAPAFAAVIPSTAILDAKNIEWQAALTKADDGTNAAPSGQGLAAMSQLIARGWTVVTN